MTRSPRLSILVATWNCVAQLRQFLESLASQSWTDWELLLLDNASSDGTAELVEEFRQRFSAGRVCWSCESDSGIYDAWNRGLELASGDYLCFIGADDTFLQPSSLESVAGLTATQAHLITARNAYCDRQGRFLRHWGSGWQWQRMRQSMNIAHPGMLMRRELFVQVGPFDATFRICGDYEWFLRLPAELRTVHSSDSVLRVVQAGVSHTRIAQVYAETFRAQRRYLGTVLSAAWWALNWAKYVRRRLIGLA
ncbi:MAG: glycosyltransferase [Cyanobacteria bacterium K_DeepCast_35m_m1_288]|nr:glycosyltransferase [Cyanobacteria bacterium K_DeepCast_35m_m1_288]